MELRSKGKTFFFALAAVCIIFTVVFAGVLAASIHDHECIGEENDCPYCLQIKAAVILLKTLNIALLALFLANRLSLNVPSSQKITEFAPLLYSPVSLKVRFNA